MKTIYAYITRNYVSKDAPAWDVRALAEEAGICVHDMQKKIKADHEGFLVEFREEPVRPYFVQYRYLPFFYGFAKNREGKIVEVRQVSPTMAEWRFVNKRRINVTNELFRSTFILKTNPHSIRLGQEGFIHACNLVENVLLVDNAEKVPTVMHQDIRKELEDIDMRISTAPEKDDDVRHFLYEDAVDLIFVNSNIKDLPNGHDVFACIMSSLPYDKRSLCKLYDYFIFQAALVIEIWETMRGAD